MVIISIHFALLISLLRVFPSSQEWTKSSFKTPSRTTSLLCVCRSTARRRAPTAPAAMNLPNEPIYAKVPTGTRLIGFILGCPGREENWALGAGQRQTWSPTGTLLRVGGWDIFMRNARHGMKEYSKRMPALARCSVDVRECRVSLHAHYTALLSGNDDRGESPTLLQHLTLRPKYTFLLSLWYRRHIVRV